jgi:hypothetical protein
MLSGTLWICLERLVVKCTFTLDRSLILLVKKVASGSRLHDQLNLVNSSLQILSSSYHGVDGRVSQSMIGQYSAYRALGINCRPAANASKELD